jgi:nanoRNase/pAp phosphatase (c-di-AMP/oligoRNAs hydrolase)
VLPVPDEVLEVLRGARRVLVIGHVPPDGDCVGAAQGLAELLRALGKEADACVDAALPGRLRGIGKAPRQAAELDEGAYDLVVLVDVAGADRIGGAARHVAKADNVLVIDHHCVAASREVVGVRDDARLTTWVMPGLEAASLQVAAIAERVVDDGAPVAATLSRTSWETIAAPLSAGVLTDTDFFKLPGASLDALRMFKHILARCPQRPDVRDGDLPDRLVAAEARVGYALPPAGACALTSSDDAEALRTARWKGLRAALTSCPREVFERALCAAQKTDPGTLPGDVRGHLLDGLDATAAKSEVAILLTETQSGVEVSVRTREATLACAIVAELFPGQGGGKPHAAAARPVGDLASVEARVAHWLDAQKAAEALALRHRRARPEAEVLPTGA